MNENKTHPDDSIHEEDFTEDQENLTEGNVIDDTESSDVYEDESLQSKPPITDFQQPFFIFEFGRVYHYNPVLNFILKYGVNLTVMVAVAAFLGVADFGSRLEIVLGFVFSYTLLEALIQRYIILRHMPLALKTFGLLFFLVYLMLLYGLDTWAWPMLPVFSNETELIVFTASMIVVRFMMISVMRRLRDRGVHRGHR